MKTNGGLVDICCGLVILSSLRVQATPTLFSIDPSQSQINLAGSLLGSPLTEQGPGSLTSSFFGTLQADVSADTIQFTGGSLLAANTNGVWQPAAGGKSGSAPADYGGQASIIVLFTKVTVQGSLRNLLLDVTSDVLPVKGGQFDASGLVFGFPARSIASFDYSAGFAGSGGIELGGLSTNRIVNNAALVNVDGAQTLTIPIDTEFKFAALSDNDTSVRLTGKLVATQVSAPAGPTITSFSIQNQTGTARVQGATTNAALQFSTDLKTWRSQTTTRSEEDNGASVFTFSLGGGVQGYFRLEQSP